MPVSETTEKKVLIHRYGLAVLGSSTIAVLVISIAVYFGASFAIGSQKMPDGAFGLSLFFVAFFGWPIAAIVTGVSAKLLERIAVDRSWNLRVAPVMMFGSVVGAVCLTAFWTAFWNDSGGVVLMATIGAVAGLFSSASFWVIAGIKPLQIRSPGNRV